MKNKYWAYLHQSGHIHVKRYWNSDLAEAVMDDAFDSPFVDEVTGPYDAESREDAERIAIERLRKAE